MRNIFLGIVSACVLAPSIASAALTLNAERISLRPGQSGFIEVFASELPPAENENMVAYSIGLNVPSGMDVTFAPAPLLNATTSHVFVYPAGDFDITDSGSAADRIRSLVTGDDPVNVTSSNPGMLRVPVTVSPNAQAGRFVPITFEMSGGLTELSDDIGNPITIAVIPGGVDIVPEPAALGLLGIGGVLFLRRRRA